MCVAAAGGRWIRLLELWASLGIGNIMPLTLSVYLGLLIPQHHNFLELIPNLSHPRHPLYAEGCGTIAHLLNADDQKYPVKYPAGGEQIHYNFHAHLSTDHAGYSRLDHAGEQRFRPATSFPRPMSLCWTPPVQRTPLHRDQDLERLTLCSCAKRLISFPYIFKCELYDYY